MAPVVQIQAQHLSVLGLMAPPLGPNPVEKKVMTKMSNSGRGPCTNRSSRRQNSTPESRKSSAAWLVPHLNAVFAVLNRFNLRVQENQTRGKNKEGSSGHLHCSHVDALNASTVTCRSMAKCRSSQKTFPEHHFQTRRYCNADMRCRCSDGERVIQGDVRRK